MKTIGKIKMCLRERAEPLNQSDVPKEKPMQDEKTENYEEELDELIKHPIAQVRNGRCICSGIKAFLTRVYLSRGLILL